MQTTTITLLGKPVSTNVVYRRHGNIMYMSAEGKKLKKSYIEQIQAQWHYKPLAKGIKIAIALFFPDMRRRDIDNWNKILLDAFTGIVYRDDCQIDSLMITKNIDKERPRIEVTVFL